ncbi:MAG: 3-hydroxyisobutyrate dehydrogenase [Alphaproteobacteria bacterium]|nr:3-hydroxyisobutyrate dehydrogenase [Alphaproteobacteria bacterium]
MNIGFIGLGNMGKGMALNLVKAGHKVSVYDINTEAVNNLNSKGCVGCSDLLTVVSDVEVVISMLPEGSHVRDVYLSENGVIANANKDALLIECSTIDINTIKNVGEIAINKGMRIIDAPVSGGIVGADNGTLTFMVGGSEVNFNSALSILSDMGKNVIHAGELGAGLAVKICNNMILGTTMIALAESFTMAKKLGLDQKKFFEISSKATGMSWAMLNHLPVANIIETSSANNNFKPGFAAEMMLKDLSLAQNAADSVNISTPIGLKALDMYKEFINQGKGSLDYSAIIKLIEESS